MRIDCEKCGTNFELTARCVEKEEREMNAFAKMAFGAFGLDFGNKCSRYWLVCPMCHKRIGKFTGSYLFD